VRRALQAMGSWELGHFHLLELEWKKGGSRVVSWFPGQTSVIDAVCAGGINVPATTILA
jgi:hypothetical protein